MRRQHIAVIGGGIQGCTVALELARRGHRVELFEQENSLCSAATRNSEGKVHLGYVYAADNSLQTARLMAEGAAQFFPLLRRWLGDACDTLRESSPFHYAIHRASVVATSQLEVMYQTIAHLATDAARRAGVDGASEVGLLERVDPSESGISGPEVAAVYRTAERAIDTHQLSDALIKAIDQDAIEVRLCTAVRKVDRRARQLSITVAEEDLRTHAYDAVVNCAWSGRLAIDQGSGIALPPNPSFRMKYFLRAHFGEKAATVPSVTIVLGGFGDVVQLGGGDLYLCWYPIGRRGVFNGARPPAWPAKLSHEDTSAFAAATLEGLCRIVPSVGELDTACVTEVNGGVIFAHGTTDVHEIDSQLHQRSSGGPRSVGRYHSVDTAKMTLAPLYAIQVANQIERLG